jgi:hypothetical protein
MAAIYASQLLTVRKTRCLTLSVLSLGGIAAVYVLYNFNPARSAFYPPCPFHALTGFYCPGCGSLRALHHFLHGHLAVAFGLNPLTIVSLPFLGYIFLSYCMTGINGKSPPPVFVPAIFIWMYLGVVLIFWVMRNIPIYPFLLPTPY